MPINSRNVLEQLPRGEREFVAELVDVREKLAREQGQSVEELKRRQLTEFDLRGPAFGFSASRRERHRTWLARLAAIEAELRGRP